MTFDKTHDARAQSWVECANGHADFPIQNLPFSIFRRKGMNEPFRGGVAIGDLIVDLPALAEKTTLPDEAKGAANECASDTLDNLARLGSRARQILRISLFEILEADAPEKIQQEVSQILIHQSEVEYKNPFSVRDYTDFYTSIHHAVNIGKIYRPDSPLSPNFKSIPIAYHGRASTVSVNDSIYRPYGQRMDEQTKKPVYGPSQALDYEVELGVYLAQDTEYSNCIPLESAEQYIFGMSLLNDWSARDIQRWESAPLGPFLSKNFATTISPWVVTVEALKPFRCAMPELPEEDSQLPYLDLGSERQISAFDIWVEASIETLECRKNGGAPELLSKTNFRHQYWSISQMITHHASNGCALVTGDLLGTGTISGPNHEEAGALIELTLSGRNPLHLKTGEKRSFLADDDRVILKAKCERDGFASIGFGNCAGTIHPPRRISK